MVRKRNVQFGKLLHQPLQYVCIKLHPQVGMIMQVRDQVAPSGVL